MMYSWILMQLLNVSISLLEFKCTFLILIRFFCFFDIMVLRLLKYSIQFRLIRTNAGICRCLAVNSIDNRKRTIIFKKNLFISEKKF
jgi:hypothetical protein